MSQDYINKTYKRIPLNYRLEDYNTLKSYCDTHSLKINTYIKLCINKCMQEGFAPVQPDHKSYYNTGGNSGADTE